MGKLDLSGSQPPYVTIANDLIASIATGTYQPGDRLPAITALALEYEVSTGTVQSALGVLRERAVVVARQGTGTFVRSDLDVAALSASLGQEPRSTADDLAEVLFLLRDVHKRLIDLDERLPRP